MAQNLVTPVLNGLKANTLLPNKTPISKSTSVASGNPNVLCLLLYLCKFSCPKFASLSNFVARVINGSLSRKIRPLCFPLAILERCWINVVKSLSHHKSATMNALLVFPRLFCKLTVDEIVSSLITYDSSQAFQKCTMKTLKKSASLLHLFVSTNIYNCTNKKLAKKAIKNETLPTLPSRDLPEILIDWYLFLTQKVQ